MFVFRNLLLRVFDFERVVKVARERHGFLFIFYGKLLTGRVSFPLPLFLSPRLLFYEIFALLAR